MAQRQLYSSAILSNYRPADASGVLRNRLSNAEKLNTEIVEWFQDRARIEEHYAGELQKLANRAGVPEQLAASQLEPTWASIVKSTRDSAEASMGFANKIHKEVQRPLRQFHKSAEWLDTRMLEDELEKLGNAYKSHDETVEKLRRKSPSRQTEVAQQSLGQIRVQWESQAPYIVDQVEAIDERRLGQIKTALTTFGTVQSDCANKGVAASEAVLSSVLAYDPSQDVAAFAAKLTAGVDVPRPSNYSMNSSYARQGSVSEIAPLDQTTSARSDSLNELDATAHKDSPSSKLRHKMGSFFRGGKKKKSIAPPPATVGETEEFSRASSPSLSQGRHRPSGASASEASLPPPSPIGAMRKPPPPPARKATNSFKNGGSGNGGVSSSNGVGVASVSAASREGQRHYDDGFQGYTLVDTSSQQGMPPQGQSLVDAPSQYGMPPQGQSLVDAPSQYGMPPQASRGASNGTNGGGDDDVALSVVASQLRARKTNSMRGQRGRRDIQSTLFSGIGPTGVENAPVSPGAAMPMPSAITTDYPFAATPTTATATPLATATPPQTYSLPADSPFAPAPVPDQMAASVPAPAAETATGGNMPDVLRPHLMHPPMPSGPGLRATLSQVVSAVVTDGVVTRASMVGEAAFTYAGPVGHSLGVQVGNMEVYDSVRPNDLYASFVKTIDFNSGLFSLDSGMLADGLPAAGFRFVDETASPFVPIDFTPIWRIEAGQSSLMLSYKVSNAFLAQTRRCGPIVLQDLVITVPVAGGTATSALSKPHAVFNSAKQRVVWKFAEPVVVKAGVEERLLCRFTTGEGGQGGEGGAVVESPKGISVSFAMQFAGISGLDGLSEHDVPLSYSEQGPQGGQWAAVPTAVQLYTGQFTIHSVENVQNNVGRGR